MNFLTDVYNQSIATSDKNIRFWEDYLQNLKSLDLNAYSDKLKVPVLVPIGSRILFRGELKHTNEVTVALGADYFTKCSLKQAEVLRQHRIKDAESRLKTFRKEREYLEKHLSFSQQNVFKNQGQEIIEVHTEEEDKAWRQRHRENVRQWKQKEKPDTEETTQDAITDEELWNRLDELELEEELENEFYPQDNEVSNDRIESFIVKEETVLGNEKYERGVQLEDVTEDQSNATEKVVKELESCHDDGEKETGKEIKEIEKTQEGNQMESVAADKYKQLQKVIDKQIELEEKLQELRHKDRAKSKTEQDLIAKLDEMEELEELQDEMDRIEDMIETEYVESDKSDDEPSSQSQSSSHKRRVCFADEDESETLQLTFHHSNIKPEHKKYDPKNGIQSPSDVYDAFPHLFTETTSILKRTKYQDKLSAIQSKEDKKRVEIEDEPAKENRTIEVKDIVEKVDVNENKLEDNAVKRPVSLFKQRRQQKKC